MIPHLNGVGNQQQRLGEEGELDVMSPLPAHAKPMKQKVRSDRVGELSPAKQSGHQGEGETAEGETRESGERETEELEARPRGEPVGESETTRAAAAYHKSSPLRGEQQGAEGERAEGERSSDGIVADQSADGQHGAAGEGEDDRKEEGENSEEEDGEEWDDNTWELRDILDAKYDSDTDDDGQLRYLIDWQGVDSNGQPWQPTWEPHGNVGKPAQLTVDDFWASEKGQQRKREREEQKERLREKRAAEKRRKEEKKRELEEKRRKKEEDDLYAEGQAEQKKYQREYEAEKSAKRARNASDDGTKTRSSKKRKAAVAPSGPQKCDVCNLAQLPFSSPPSFDTVKCGQCGCTVHPLCYQPSLPIDAEAWVCNACLFTSAASRSLDCCLCGRDGGALWPAYPDVAPAAPLDPSSTPPYFAHVCCAVSLPEEELTVSSHDTAGYVEQLDTSGKPDHVVELIELRQHTPCMYCEQQPEPYNAPLLCCFDECDITFHITCGRLAGCVDRQVEFIDEETGKLKKARLWYCKQHTHERHPFYEKEQHDERMRGEHKASDEQHDSTEGVKENRQQNGHAEMDVQGNDVTDVRATNETPILNTNGTNHIDDREKGKKRSKGDKERKAKKPRKNEGGEKEVKVDKRRKKKGEADDANEEKVTKKKKKRETDDADRPKKRRKEQNETGPEPSVPMVVDSDTKERSDGSASDRGTENGPTQQSSSPARFASPLSPTASPSMSPPPASAPTLPTTTTSRIPKKNSIPRVGQQAVTLTKQSASFGRQTSDPTSTNEASSAANGSIPGPALPSRQTSPETPSSSAPATPPVDPVDVFILQTKDELAYLTSFASTSDRLRHVSPAALITQLTQLSSISSDAAAIIRIHAALATPAQISHIVAVLQLCNRAIREESNSSRHSGWVELAKELCILLTKLWKVRQWVIDQLKAVDAIIRVLREEAEKMTSQGEEWLQLLAYSKRLINAYEAAKPKDAALPKHALDHQKGREYYQHKPSYGMGSLADLKSKAQGFFSGTTAAARQTAQEKSVVEEEKRGDEKEEKTEVAQSVAPFIDTFAASSSSSAANDSSISTRPPTPASTSKRVPPIRLPHDNRAAVPTPLWPIPKNPLRQQQKRSVSWKNDDEIEEVRMFFRDKPEVEKGTVQGEAYKTKGGREALRRQYSKEKDKEEGRALLGERDSEGQKEDEDLDMMDGEAQSSAESKDGTASSPASVSRSRNAMSSVQPASPSAAQLSRGDLFPARPVAGGAAPAVPSSVLLPSAGALPQPGAASSPALDLPAGSVALSRFAPTSSTLSSSRRGAFPTLPPTFATASSSATAQSPVASPTAGQSFHFPPQSSSPTSSLPSQLPPLYPPPQDNGWSAVTSTPPPVHPSVIEAERQRQASRQRGEAWDQAKRAERAKAREALNKEREREVERQRSIERERAAEIMRQREEDAIWQQERENREREREEGEVVESPLAAESQRKTSGKEPLKDAPKSPEPASNEAREEAARTREEDARLWRESAARRREEARERQKNAVRERSPLSEVTQPILPSPASPPAVSS